MRLDRLHLIAFGPFTGQQLDLSGGAPGGLHVIYGPNEAGKSTSLRAVKNFLFGIPQRSPDAHHHPAPKLAIQAEISGGGQRYVLTRRKRRKDDLLNSDGTPVASNPIFELLGHIDEQSFSQRFGLDQVELERGAEALLGGSEQGLFAAGTAGAEAREVLDALAQECDALFLPRGKMPLLNKRLTEYERAARELHRAQRPPEKWLEQERAHVRAVDRAANLKAERGRVRAELRRCNRLKAVISDLSDYQKLAERQRELVEVPDLPDGATGQREEASLALSLASVEARRIKDEIRASELELAQLPAESPLAEVDEEQLDLNARVGTALSARKDLPKRRTHLLELERQLSALLREMGREVKPESALEHARALMVGDEVTAVVKRMSTERGALEAQVKEAERRLLALEVDRAQLAGQDESAPEQAELAQLGAALSEAQAAFADEIEAGRLEEELATVQAETERLRGKWGTEKDARELATLLPSLESVRTALARVQKVQEQRDEFFAQQERTRRELRDQLSALEVSRAFELPSEDQLRELRRARDACVTTLKSSMDVRILTELAGRIAAADEVSDRLRREADRVYELAALSAKVSRLREDVETLGDRIQRLDDALHKSSDDFTQLLLRLGVERALSLDVSLQLTEELARLVQQEFYLQSLQERLARRRARMDSARVALQSALGQDSTLGLRGLAALATERLSDGSARLARAALVEESGKKLARAQADAIDRLEEVRAAFCTWQGRWAEAVASLGLPPDASVGRAQEVLGVLDRVGRVVIEASQLVGRIRGMERDTDALSRDVSRVLSVHMPGAPEEDPVDAALRLQEALRSAHRNSEERRRLKLALEQRRARLSEAEARVERAAQQLEHLRQAAGASDVQDLARVEAASREKREVTDRMNLLLERIRIASDGTPIAELIEQARPWRGSVSRLASEIDDLDAQNAELEQLYREAEVEVEGTRMGLSTYASEDVAIARQVSADRAAAAREALRTYLVKRAAQTLLQRQMAAYAERFRGPIAGKAGQLFERITLGKYSGLSIGVGERTLRCVGAGQEKEVHELSRGTRAQLYFVLRMASLFSYFQDHPKVPLVFDDLFVDFDDDRATVAFELLSEMAEHTQVLYFTHLARDVEKAHDAVPSPRLFCHTLGV